LTGGGNDSVDYRLPHRGVVVLGTGLYIEKRSLAKHQTVPGKEKDKRKVIPVRHFRSVSQVKEMRGRPTLGAGPTGSAVVGARTTAGWPWRR
jgi:hypothetical protein